MCEVFGRVVYLSSCGAVGFFFGGVWLLVCFGFLLLFFLIFLVGVVFFLFICFYFFFSSPWACVVFVLD